MAALVTIETVVLILLAMLVAGLLRSHAEILRRLESPPASEVDPGLPPDRGARTAAFDVAGTTIWGDPMKVAVAGAGRDTLLAFLSSGCASCGAFWGGLSATANGALPGDVRIVVVTKDGSHESPAKLRDLAPPDVPVVMSSAGWDDYAVKGSPYFIHVDGGSGRVRGEGTASNWSQVVSLLNDAVADAAGPPGRASDSTPERLLRADRELSAAGIEAGHPSLYRADG
jgi:hypothetical protein